MGPDLDIIDVHCHLLPAMDDGPRNQDESLAICAMMASDGVRTVVATPHMGDPRFSVSPAAVRRGAEQLTRACRQHGIALDVLPGGDVRLRPELLSAVQTGEVVTIGNAGTHLLLELPQQNLPAIEGLTFELMVRGITPVLSHPERNAACRRSPGRLAALVEQGCRLQITAGALLGLFGRSARQAAERLLRNGLVHAVASDAHADHGPRRPVWREAVRRLCKLVGEEMTSRLVNAGPAAMTGRAPQAAREVTATPQPQPDEER